MDHKKTIKFKIITVVFFSICGIFALVNVFWNQDREMPVFYELTEWEEEQQEITEQELSVLIPEINDEEVVKRPKEVLLYVHVCGAVLEEGVYALPQGSRGVDAVQAAGGFTEDAATAYCNLAEMLTDGMRLYIPTQEEVVGGLIPAVSTQGKDTDGMVDINTADKETFMTLPGIGETKAENIVKYRSRVGKFQTIEELMNVSGIGQAVFEALRDKITVTGDKKIVR